MSNFKDLTGLRFGKLLVIEELLPRVAGKNTKWVCLCDCGEETIVAGGDLTKSTRKPISSCGCSRIKHNLSGSPLYKIYCNMKGRCIYSPNDYYEGVSICDRWLEPAPQGFLNFVEDMEEGYCRGYELDRKDTHGNYCKDNCRWVTHAENIFNRGSVRKSASMYKGVTWCKRDNKWMAKIGKDGKTIFIGRYDTEIEAAKAYNLKAEELFGEYAYLNKIETGEI